MPELRVIFMDAGQGDSTLVVFPDDTLLLVDCGSRKSGAVVRPQIGQVLARYLAPTRGRIERLIITHADEDHYNQLLPVLNAFPSRPTVGASWFGGALAQYQNARERNLTHDWLRDNSTPLGASVHQPTAPWFSVAGAHVYLLAANATGRVDSPDTNANSVVLLVVYAGVKIFLMGDATELTERAILLSNPRPAGPRPPPVVPPSILARDHATALKMGHHGSDTSSSDLWIRTLQPNALFISSDTKAFGRYGTGIPRIEHLESVVRLNPPSPARAHDFVAFHPTAANPPRGEFRVSSTLGALFTTLHSPENGSSFHYVVSGMGNVSVDWTG